MHGGVKTGSGNIIISIANELEKDKIQDTGYYAIDISKDALKIAKKNAKVHDVDKKIKFINGSLLSPFLFETKNTAWTSNAKAVF